MLLGYIDCGIIMLRMWVKGGNCMKGSGLLWGGGCSYGIVLVGKELI